MQIAQPKSEIGSQRKRVGHLCILRGQGQYVEAVRLAGMAEVGFLRSPYAHAPITRSLANGQSGS